MIKKKTLPLIMTCVLALLLMCTGCASNDTEDGASAAVSADQSQPDEAVSADNDTSSDAPSADVPDEPVQATEETDNEADYFALGEALFESESIGKVRLYMSDSELTDALGQPDSQSEPEFWGADGSEHSVWSYLTLGLYLDMARDSEAEGYTVNSITAADPCVLETQRGIKIGDSKDDVLAAYADVYNVEESSEDVLIFGSIFGGMLITLEDDVVTGFFIGAMAE